VSKTKFSAARLCRKGMGKNMAVVLEVAGHWYEIGISDFLHSFFSTVSYNLEKEWGSRFPYMMKKFYKGKLKYRDVDKARRELLIIRKELEKFPPTKAIWDIDDLSKQEPWEDDISDEMTNLSNYFFTCEGDDLFEVILAAFKDAQESKEDVIIRRVDFDDPGMLYFDCRQ